MRGVIRRRRLEGLTWWSAVAVSAFAQHPLTRKKHGEARGVGAAHGCARGTAVVAGGTEVRWHGGVIGARGVAQVGSQQERGLMCTVANEGFGRCSSQVEKGGFKKKKRA